MKENFIHVTRENMNRIIETSEGQDKEDLEYLMKYYGKDLKKRTESVVTVPLNIIEQAKDDRLDIPRIVHALLLLQKDPIDPMRLIYKKNQMISHYFRDL